MDKHKAESLSGARGDRPPEEQTPRRGILTQFFRHIKPTPHPELAYMKKKELPVTPVFREAIGAANHISSRLMRAAGVTPFDIYEKDVHLLPSEAWDHLNIEEPHQGGQGTAYSDQYHRIILLCADFYIGNVELCQDLLHEFFHLKACNTVEPDPSSPQHFSFRRVGFRIYRTRKRKETDPAATAFVGLDEAVTAKLEMKYLPQMLRSASHLRALSPRNHQTTERLKKEVAKRENLPIEEIAWVGPKGEHFSVFSYRSQRMVLDYIIQEIAKDKRMSESEVFDVFAKSYFNGKLLKVAELIRGSFGKDAFRILGAMTEDSNSARLILDVFQGLRRGK